MIRTKKKKTTPAISTASLPDIVFMLLFFFMVATKMKEITLKVEVRKPKASAATKIYDKSTLRSVYIGRPTADLVPLYGTQPRLQINDYIADIPDLDAAVNDWRNEINEAERLKLTISLKVDESTKMGIVSDVKERLRDLVALKISYAALKTTETAEEY
ncbi:MAG: biopolymer transporter ExbD [Flavobacteriales bacterium]|nr:biopolymer transporter ExbD [Flavobacteriales bacterium]MCX7767769.1 biopolymer transporter ExbD [Flavobacteriales bacterium]MDW8410290.1 biopolymer transporter ExbD [Flavobacteriales bacterium]